MSNYLLKKEINLNDNKVTIYQLSGLDRFDFIDYTAKLPVFIEPKKLDEGATEAEKSSYAKESVDYLYKLQKKAMQGQSRLVAIGCRELGDDIEQRQDFVMKNMTAEQIKYLHDEIALLSGLILSDKSESKSEDGEPTDPKL